MDTQSTNNPAETIDKFERGVHDFILKLLYYIGFIGAAILTVAYIALVWVFIAGFEASAEFTNLIIFAICNGVIGLMICQMLKLQGITFAKNITSNRIILEEYYNTKTKDKKPQSIGRYWLKSLIQDFFLKAVTIILSTGGIVYVVIQGTNDYTMLLIAIVNLLMFICFGLLSMNSAYQFYNNYHIPYIKEKIEEVKEIKNEQ